MSLMSDAITAGLATLATAKGQSLQYATAHGQAFAALAGFVLIQDRIVPPAYGDDERAGIVPQTGIIKGPLTPALSINYEIKDVITGAVWAVEGVKTDVQQVATVRRTDLTERGPDRGGFA